MTNKRDKKDIEKLQQGSKSSLSDATYSILGIFKGDLAPKKLNAKIMDVKPDRVTWQVDSYLAVGYLIDVQTSRLSFQLQITDCKRGIESNTYVCIAEPFESNFDLTTIFSSAKDSSTNKPIRPRLLIVDDEEELREVLMAFFEGSGFHSESAINGKDALEKLNGQSFDLVLCDILMPEMTGNELFKKLKQRYEERGQSMPTFFFMTGYADYTNNDAYEDLASGHFAKPFNLELMLTALNKKFVEIQKESGAKSTTFFVGRDGLCLIVDRDGEEPEQILRAG